MKELMVRLAKKSGKMTITQKRGRISFKRGKEIVTELDRKIERFIVKEIKKKYPNHNIIGEEFEYKKTDSPYTWVIDPIDGTINFVKGFPHFCTAIVLLKNNEPIMSVTYDPSKNHLFYAKKGEGAFLNNKRIHVSSTTELRQAIVELSESDKSDRTLKLTKKLLYKTYRIRRLGSTALSLCYVAVGWTDCRFKTTIGLFDVAGGALLVREAGGVVTDLKGNPWRIDKNTGLLASNRSLNKKFLKLVK